jgi:hypothetical protein
VDGGTAPETGTFTHNEAAGELDSVNLCWPWSDRPLEVSALVVRRIC